MKSCLSIFAALLFGVAPLSAHATNLDRADISAEVYKNASGDGLHLYLTQSHGRDIFFDTLRKMDHFCVEPGWLKHEPTEAQLPAASKQASQ